MSATMKRLRKIPMKKRETPKQRAVSFSKRRHGLFKKAAELCMLSGSQVGFIVSSPASKQNWYSFGHPSVEPLFDAFLHGRVPQHVDAETMDSAISVYNSVKDLEGELEKRRGKSSDGVCRDFEFDDQFEVVLERCQSVSELQVVVDEMEKLRENAVERLSNLLASKDSEFGSENNIYGMEDDDGDLGAVTKAYFNQHGIGKLGSEVKDKSIVVSGDDHYSYCSSYQDANHQYGSNSLTMVPYESNTITHPHQTSSTTRTWLANPAEEAMSFPTLNEAWFANPVDEAMSITTVNSRYQLLSYDDPLFYLG